MAAWADDDQAYDRDESYGQHVTSEAFYPDWQPDECSAADLCAAIDAATRTFARLADETATLTTFARRVA